MLKNKEKEILEKLRYVVKEEIARQNLDSPLFSIQCDYKTKKLKLNYSFPRYKGLNQDNEKVFKKQQKDFYLKNVTLFEENIFLNNLGKYIQILNQKIKKDSKDSFLNDSQSIIYWTRRYTNTSLRSDFKPIKDSSIKGDKESLNALIKYCKKNDTKMLDIWEWPSNGKDFIINYMKFKQSLSSERKKPWSDGTVNSNYQRIRAFFNWISDNKINFPRNLLARLIFNKSKREVLIIKESELDEIKNFIDNFKNSNRWSWFVEMLIVFLETGIKPEVLCSLKLKDVNLNDKTLFCSNRSDNKQDKNTHKISEYSWNIISHLIVNNNNILRIDKQYLFHQRFYRKTSKKEYKLIENLNKSFSINGFRKKFSEMVNFIGISKRTTPQTYLNYYIIKLLKSTKNDIHLVSNYFGVSHKKIINNFMIRLKADDYENKFDFLSKVTPNSKPKPKSKRLKDGGVSVPFMITREMLRELVSMGYSKSEISKMESEEAHNLIIERL